MYCRGVLQQMVEIGSLTDRVNPQPGTNSPKGLEGPVSEGLSGLLASGFGV